MRVVAMIALATLFAVGCKTGPDYQRPSLAVPEEWRSTTVTNWSLGNLSWWTFYRDPVLTNLIAIALTNNYEVRIAAARIEEAAGGYQAQRSYLFPSLDASAAWSRGRVGNIPPTPGATYEQTDVFGLLSYEVDLWGRLRRLTESAQSELLATEEARRTIEMTLVATVARNYFELRSLDRQLEIARETYRSRTNTLRLTRVKFDEENGRGQGIVSELDVRQAETQVFGAQVSIASLERLVALTESALRFLLGQPPGEVPRGLSLADQWQPGEIPAGLPSALLLRRPDVRGAEQRLIAANANIGAARAAYFPTISLTAALGVQSVELDDLFTTGASKAWKLAPQVVGPIFNGGRIRAGVRVAEARHQAALVEYESAIQNAFREVDDALISILKLREQLAAESANVKAEQRRFELSLLRYEEGISSYTDLLDAQRFLFSAQLAEVQTRSLLQAAVTQLYKALGGGWDMDAVQVNATP